MWGQYDSRPPPTRFVRPEILGKRRYPHCLVFCEAREVMLSLFTFQPPARLPCPGDCAALRYVEAHALASARRSKSAGLRSEGGCPQCGGIALARVVHLAPLTLESSGGIPRKAPWMGWEAYTEWRATLLQRRTIGGWTPKFIFSRSIKEPDQSRPPWLVHIQRRYSLPVDGNPSPHRADGAGGEAPDPAPRKGAGRKKTDRRATRKVRGGGA